MSSNGHFDLTPRDSQKDIIALTKKSTHMMHTFLYLYISHWERRRWVVVLDDK